jgi:hypothetical protein
MIVNKRGPSVIGTNGTIWSVTANAIDGAFGVNPATYAVWSSSTSGATGYIEIGCPFTSEVPSDATLVSVTVKLRHFESNTSRITSVTMQPFDGSTAIGTPFTCTRATAARDDTATFPVTLAQLRSPNFKIRAFAGRAAVTQSATFNVDHVDITVDYTPAHIPGRLNIWNGSAWVEKPMKAWSGSAWVEKPVMVWNGSSWVPA